MPAGSTFCGRSSLTQPGGRSETQFRVLVQGAPAGRGGRRGWHRRAGRVRSRWLGTGNRSSIIDVKLFARPVPPAGFTEPKVQVNGIGINYVRGGHGPTLLLLHGYPETWYTWDQILPALAQHYTVVAPDLPGAGLSDAPAAAADYTKKAMAADIYALMVKLGLSHDIRIVGHDIGTGRLSYTAAHPDES